MNIWTRYSIKNGYPFSAPAGPWYDLTDEIKTHLNPFTAMLKRSVLIDGDMMEWGS